MASSTNRRFNPENLLRLTETERQARWQPEQRLKFAGLKPGARVLELGCGPGFWTLPIAKIVGPQGGVFALDVSSEMLCSLTQQSLPGNICAVQSELPSIPLSNGWAEFIWLAFIFHEVEPPANLATQLFRVARPGTRVAVLDWQKVEQSDTGPPLAHRLSASQVISFLHTAGFSGVETRWHDLDAYLITAERRHA
jgi:ubiquinone/menaquinone biosynthesis C-methylase UbiE